MSIISERRGHTKPNQPFKEALLNLIIHYTQVVQNPIANDCLNVCIDCISKKQRVPKLVLQVYVRELHNRMVSPQEADELKE